MRNKLAILVSIFSIMIAVVLIIFSYVVGGINGLEGAGWILGVLGAPTTLLDFFIYKAGLSRGLIPDLIWIIFFYLVQYQFIAMLVATSKGKRRIILAFLIFVIILISSSITWQIIIGKIHTP